MPKKKKPAAIAKKKTSKREAERDRFRDFLEELTRSILECATNNQTSKVQVSISGQIVTVDIYQDAGEMKKFGDALTNALKAQTSTPTSPKTPGTVQ